MAIFFRNGKLAFGRKGSLATTKQDCYCCDCCGDDCHFNSCSKIKDYDFVRQDLIDGVWTNVNRFEGNKDFTYDYPCCFCFLYNYYEWDAVAGEWEFIDVRGDPNEAGFCYGCDGWWDGNGAGYDSGTAGIAVKGGKSYFGKGICDGAVTVTYFYSPVSRANVEFTVSNPQCKPSNLV